MAGRWVWRGSMAVFHSGTSPNTFFYRRNTECLETVLQGHKRLAMFVSMSINKDPYVIWLVLSSFNSRNSNDFMSFKMGLNRWLVTHHNSRQQLENHKCIGVAMTMPHEGVSLHLFLFPGNNHHFCNMPCYFQLVASFSWARFPLSWRYLSIFLFSQLSPHFLTGLTSNLGLGIWHPRPTNTCGSSWGSWSARKVSLWCHNMFWLVVWNMT